EPVVTTPVHRFWKAGQGWVMARELKPGDTLRVVGGVARVVGVSSEKIQPVFNLEVGKDQSFFVGGQGLLVHDNSLIRAGAGGFDGGPLSH
ncbi:polymorphic toxin-type HINT domain-containing protein, partial [Singulisphaera rosea]